MLAVEAVAVVVRGTPLKEAEATPAERVRKLRRCMQTCGWY
jgi:hypothetical protein